MAKEQVTRFLAEFKRIASTKGIVLIRRDKTIQGLVDLGLTKMIALNELTSLTLQEYVSGPEADKDPNCTGDIWVFGKVINGIPAYIKLKIEVKGGCEFAKCLSFHPAEYVMHFPFSF
jgi:hypothetical protein